MAALLSVSEARQLMLDAFSPVGVTRTDLKHASGKVLAENIIADTDWPPFSNSSMDGFAVHAQELDSASTDHPVTLRVQMDIPAGSVFEPELITGCCARIMTGAPVPSGADAVIPIEDTNQSHDTVGQPLPLEVNFYQPIKVGGNIRPKGQDLRSGQTALHSGDRLRAPEVGLLAQLGKTRFSVYRKPAVAVISSGDELLAPNQPLTSGKIHDSNSYTLSALIEQHGGRVIDLGIAPDRYSDIQERLDQAVELGVNLILTSAGVSVGNLDLTRSVVQAHGNLDFWRVNMRPGKPVAFGSYRGTPFIGLPGNPGSAFVGFLVFVAPILSRLSGGRTFQNTILRARLTEPVGSDGRESYLRAVITLSPDGNTVRLTGHQGSGNLYSFVQANALLIVPSGVKSLPTGSEVDVWLLES